MDIGKAYLCEVWMLPPDMACNGDGPVLRVMRYVGEMAGGDRSTVITCGGQETRFTANDVLQLWEPTPDSSYHIGQLGWKIIPLRPLEADTEVVDEEALVLHHQRLLPGLRQERHLEGAEVRSEAEAVEEQAQVRRGL
jgi:hypothetical protein